MAATGVRKDAPVATGLVGAGLVDAVKTARLTGVMADLKTAVVHVRTSAPRRGLRVIPMTVRRGVLKAGSKDAGMCTLPEGAGWVMARRTIPTVVQRTAMRLTMVDAASTDPVAALGLPGVNQSVACVATTRGVGTLLGTPGTLGVRKAAVRVDSPALVGPINRPVVAGLLANGPHAVTRGLLTLAGATAALTQQRPVAAIPDAEVLARR